jgi:outer membrane immunogenic protein
MRRFQCALLAAVAAIGFASVASAADMPAKAPVYKAAPVAMYNWTGFYVGLNAGGSWGHQDNSLVDTTTGITLLENSDHIDGFIGGGQIGYNWQVNQWVFGLEADFQGSGQKADGAFALPVIGAPGSLSIAYTDKLDWFGTVRGRLGWAIDRWMPYITGGWAYGHGELSGTSTFLGITTASSDTHNYSGWTIGGGVEWAFYNNWSAKFEYLYIDFGDATQIIAPTVSVVSGTLTDNIVRGGINYRF